MPKDMEAQALVWAPGGPQEGHGLEEGEGAPRDVRGGEPRGLVARRAAAKAMILCSQGASAILRRSLKGISGEAEGE